MSRPRLLPGITRPTEWQMEELPFPFNALTLVPIHANIDGVDMRFDATVITDFFPPDICLGSYVVKISHAKLQRVEPASIASLVVSFTIPDAAPMPLKGLIDPAPV